MKILTIVGARPQFVKAAAIHRAISLFNEKNEGKKIHEVLVHTGQHYDSNMSDLFFQEMGITQPHYHLGIGGISHGAMTGRMLEKLEEIYIKEKPDWVLVYGDTNSTIAGALAAVKLHIPVAHVEAGLRSFNRRMPEEINRILTDHSSDLLFTPTERATRQLFTEGIKSEKVMQVGDVMYDVSLFYHKQILKAKKSKDISSLSGRRDYVLTTIHRAENTDHPLRLKEIFLGLSDIAKDFEVIVPLHPRTKKFLEKEGLFSTIAQKLHLIEPVGYLDMIRLQMDAKAILTDSGGVQKEAYFFQVPCITLRDETEWVELVDHGFNTLVPADRAQIQKSLHQSLESRPNWGISLYGKGDASEKIVEALTSFLS